MKSPAEISSEGYVIHIHCIKSKILQPIKQLKNSILFLILYFISKKSKNKCDFFNLPVS